MNQPGAAALVHTQVASMPHPPQPHYMQALPWLKLVASLREPISRFLSMLGHNVDKSNYNCLLK